MSGTSAGLKKSWTERRARYGKTGMAPDIAAARHAGVYEKRTVAILDSPFRLSGLTPDILRHWKDEYQDSLLRADRAIAAMIRLGKPGTAKGKRDLENRLRETKTLVRHARQYRRAIETGKKYLESNHGKARKAGKRR